MKIKVVLGADHDGLALKSELKSWLESQGYDVMDLGAKMMEPSDDYPDYADAVAQAVVSNPHNRGILICGSGVGACIAANKVHTARACVCHDTYSAHQGVEHDDMNILCLGARVIGIELARELTNAFLKAEFSCEERFRRRLNKIAIIEKRSYPVP
jgi:ribose 5-phosphate isomerase B